MTQSREFVQALSASRRGWVDRDECERNVSAASGRSAAASASTCRRDSQNTSRFSP